MKFEGIPGVFYAQAFVIYSHGMKLCGCFHSTKLDAKIAHSEFDGRIDRLGEVEWPVEITDGIAYVPSEEELKGEH